MNIDSGEFKCPRCRNNTVYCTISFRSNENQFFINNNSTHFKYYLNREEYGYNGLQKTWIFYNGMNSKWECCKCCVGECHNFCTMSFFCCHSHGCNGSVIFLPCSSIIYILFFFWIDLIYYLCCNNKEYSGIKGRYSSFNNNKFDNYEEIFNKIGGLTEQEWISRYSIWICSKCKFSAKTFLQFISNSENRLIQYENENETKYIKLDVKNSESSRNEDEIINILFTSYDKKIKFTISCKRGDLFKLVIQKLFKKHPELKKKNCHFLSNGNIIDQNKTCAENKIKSGDIIMIEFSEECESNKEDSLAILFYSEDQKINLCVPCETGDLFKSVIQKLFKEYPELENKNCKYKCNDNIINQEKTCAENKIKSGDTIIIEINDTLAIFFISGDQQIKWPIPCKGNDLFKAVMEKLFKKYPELKKQNCFFLCNGSIIDQNKTCTENKIKSGDNINIQYYE